MLMSNLFVLNKGRALFFAGVGNFEKNNYKYNCFQKFKINFHSLKKVIFFQIYFP